VLLGGLCALFATGLSLSFGTMRLVNLAQSSPIRSMSSDLVIEISPTVAGIGAGRLLIS
jgi:hypothetical protein